MESSKKSNSTDFYQHVAKGVVAQLPEHSSILVGLSGGVDSVVLLHIMSRLTAQHAWKVTALHVNHGISSQAGKWADFCQKYCTSLSIPLHIQAVDIAALRHHGVEAAARKLRYQAFSRQHCDFVALAHHADDQVETVLLQLLRGAGVRGASAMPTIIQNAVGLNIVRPLLPFSRQAILDYASEQNISWVEDESNADDHHPRNFLRHRILPILEEKFPAYRKTLSRSALNFSEASSLLDELARIDAQLAIQNGTLGISTLRTLEQVRAKNLLRYFMGVMGAPMPAVAKLDDILRQLLTARNDAMICIHYGDWQVRRYKNQVYVMPLFANFDLDIALSWQGETKLDWLPLQQQLKFTSTQGSGISVKKIQAMPVIIKVRRNGETIRPNVGGSARTLKNLFQENGIPPWQRERLPLLYCGDKLVCVPGVAIAAEFKALTSEPGILVSLTK
jgi:tRNA(Ile)-lysidine synthase